MREIKFRAWDGLFMLDAEDLSSAPSSRKWLGHYDYPLMQYVGLKDKAGVEIYEGDVVAYRYETWGVEHETRIAVEYITYQDGGYEDSWSGVGFNLSPGEHKLGESVGEYQVIGNIYDNPELLEGHS